MQLNFLDPEYIAELERQRHLDEEEHRAAAQWRKANSKSDREILIKTPVARPVSEQKQELQALKTRVNEIEVYFERKEQLATLEQEAQDAKAAYDKAERYMFALQKEGLKPSHTLMEKVWELQDRAFDTKNTADIYKYNMGITPACARLDELKARIAEIEATQSLPEPPVIQVIDSCEWSGQTLLCPHCPGELVPQSPVTWTCTDDSSHKAWPHTGMMACRGLGGTRYWVPGMFDKVIPVAETPVLPDRYLHEPVCAFCESDLVQIAPQGWECASNSMHRFWVHHKCGVWTDRHGGSILKKAPDWAMGVVTV